MLLDHPRGDRGRARTLLEEALGMYQSLGMARHVEMVADVLRGEPI